MKNIIFKGLIACSAVVMMAGCSENSWNKEYLPGFDADELGQPSGTTAAEYTLTTSDFSAISKNTTNVALAEAAGQSTALKNLASDEFFTPAIPAKEYLPAFMASPNFAYYYANDGSTVNLTYSQMNGASEEYTALTAAKTYTVTTDDYKTAWGSEEDYIGAFAPAATATAKLPAILKDALADATKGQYAVVTYKQASENPIFGTIDGGEDNVVDLSTLTTGDPIKVSGQIAAISNFGPILATEGGNAFIYDRNTKWNTYAVGDKLTVEGTVSNYYGGLQITNPTYTSEGNAEMKYPTPTEWTEGDVQAYMDLVAAAKNGSPVPARYIKFTGKLTISSGKYYNFYIGNATKYVGLYQQTDNQKAGLVDGQTYTLTGYAMTTGTGGVNFIPTYIDGKYIPPFNAPAMAVSRSVAYEPASESVTAVYQFDGSAWEAAEGVAALSAADYTAMGFSVGSLSDPDIYLPLFLKNKYPYALPGDTMYVVYNGTSVAQLDYNGTTWTVNTDNLATVTTQWKKTGNTWKFVKTVGVAVFDLVNTEVVLGRKYLMVADGICAIPLDASKNYGYLYTAAVKVGAQIELASDVNAFEFATSYGDQQCPEGKFLIKDTNDRYLYMQGTYNSFNVTATPVVDGALNPSALFTVTANGDGTWKISTEVSGSEKWIQYSTSYGSWGCYSTVNGLDPTLYLLAE